MNLYNSAPGVFGGACLSMPLCAESNKAGRSVRRFFDPRPLSALLLFLLLICCSQRTPAQSISFSSPAKVATGGAAATAITTADFNGDGKADLAAANQDSYDLSVALGNGDGTLSTVTLYSAGYSPRAITSGDLNGDGKPDLVVANESGNDISVLLGNGDGTFQAALSCGPVDRPEHIAIADLNSDGKDDLAVASFGGSVSVMFGVGDGTFQPPVSYTTGMASASVAVGDFNGDGKPDLAAANQDSDDLSILINSGDGSFAAAVNYGTAPSPVSIGVSDFNQDGKLDLVTAGMGEFSNGYFSGNGFLSVLSGNGDGTFQAAVNYAVGTVPHSVAIGDLNQDGLPELVVANAYGNTVSILANNGDGTFGTPVDFGTGDPSTPFAVSLCDFNGDGMQDIATANFVDNSASILLNQTTLITLKQSRSSAKIKSSNGKSTPKSGR
jgi:hypothetical protein